MTKNRLEAFSDGVIAIIITIMVLELNVPDGHALADLRPLLPHLAAYAMSFVYLGIYWHNHHHMLQAVKHVNGKILWANSNLLFWLSLFPFGTAWMGESGYAVVPVVVYGVVLTLAAVAYYLLARSLVKHHGRESPLAKALGADFKGRISIVLYLAAIGLALASPWIAVAIYTAVALIWVVPDRRIENILLGRSAA
jgi:uncharacterized membrane protein